MDDPKISEDHTDVEIAEIRRMVDEQDFPEWLGATADMDWEELTDYQKQFFQNYAAFMAEEHKNLGLAVRHRNPTSMARKMTAALAETQAAAEAKLHQETIHFMGYDKHGSKGPGVYCSCGMFKIHKRGKVLAAWADKHFEKYNHYWKRS